MEGLLCVLGKQRIVGRDRLIPEASRLLLSFLCTDDPLLNTQPPQSPAPTLCHVALSKAVVVGLGSRIEHAHHRTHVNIHIQCVHSSEAEP